MKNKNSQKGITIIALVITVIMLLILASVATYTGIESYDKAEQIKFVSQMKLIQTKVDEKVQEDGFTLEGYGTILTDEQICSVCASACGIDSISSLSPAAKPFCTKADEHF